MTFEQIDVFRKIVVHILNKGCEFDLLKSDLSFGTAQSNLAATYQCHPNTNTTYSVYNTVSGSYYSSSNDKFATLRLGSKASSRFVQIEIALFERLYYINMYELSKFIRYEDPIYQITFDKDNIYINDNFKYSLRNFERLDKLKMFI